MADDGIFFPGRSLSGEDVGFWGDGMLEKKVFFFRTKKCECRPVRRSFWNYYSCKGNKTRRIKIFFSTEGSVHM